MINNWKESLKWISKIFFPPLKCIYNASVLYIAWMFNQLSFMESSVPEVLWYMCAKQATWMSKPWSSSSWVETDLTRFVEGCAREKLVLHISAALCNLEGSWTSLNSSCCSTYRMTGEGPANCSPGPQVQPAAGKSSGFFISAEAKSQPCFNKTRGTGMQSKWMYERSSWCLLCTKRTCQVPCCRYFSRAGGD